MDYFDRARITARFATSLKALIKWHIANRVGERFSSVYVGIRKHHEIENANRVNEKPFDSVRRRDVIGTTTDSRRFAPPPDRAGAMSDCFVNAKDYAQHFSGEHIAVADMPTWSGTDRRIGLKDRRTLNHERRWESSRGRRFRVADRRKIQS